MAVKHGVYTYEIPTRVATPVVASTGISFVIGTAPIQSAAKSGGVGVPILAYNWAEAVEKLGYSDDWNTYTLCEFMYSHFKLFGQAPVIFCNLLDPKTMKVKVPASVFAVSDYKAKLPIAAINDKTLIVSSANADPGKAAVYTLTAKGLTFSNKPQADMEFTVQFGSDPAASVDVATGATAPATDAEFAALFAGTSFTVSGMTFTASVSGAVVTYTADSVGVTDTIGSTVTITWHDPSGGDMDVGITGYTAAFTQGVAAEGAYVKGEDYDAYYYNDALVVELLSSGDHYDDTSLSVAYNAVTTESITPNAVAMGFESIELCMSRVGIVPDIICAPGFSQDSTVAAIMATKAAALNGLFGAKALIDMVTEEYSGVIQDKNSMNLTDLNQVLCWPMVKLGDKVFHLSTQMAGLMSFVDNKNQGVPYESPSNKSLKCDGSVIKVGGEYQDVFLTHTQANYLNEGGITTTLNFIGGWKLWGNYTACYPVNTDVKDYFLCISRMFDWVAKTLINTFWGRVDNPMNERLVGTILDTCNIWLNGLTGQGYILGGRAEYLAEDNPLASLMAGILKIHIFLTPPSPAQEIDFLLEYDVDYVTAAFGG